MSLDIYLSKMEIKNGEPVILIDTSYFVFFRYYSSIRWYQFKNKDITYDSIHDDDVFITAFYKHLQQDLNKLKKTWKTSQIIFCCDCSRDQIWRNEFIGAYKQTRVANPTFNGQIFVKFFEYIERQGETIVTVDKLEADDVVYLMKMALVEKGFTNDIIVITNDNDYLQLLDPQTKIYNMNPSKNNLAERSCGNAMLDLRIKLIMGDKVDNIPAMHGGIGPKTAMKLARLSEGDFEMYLDVKNCRGEFMRNKKIIDFSEIPDQYREAFKSKYEMNII